MMPKISVSPLATRNSSRPYCTALRHWTRNVAMSIGMGIRGAGARRRRAKGRVAPDSRPANATSRGRPCSWEMLHRAAGRRIGERLHRDADDHVLRAGDLAQVDVLHRL